MADTTRRNSLMAQPPRPMSTTEIKQAFGQKKSVSRRRPASGAFSIVEDSTVSECLDLLRPSPLALQPPIRERRVLPSTRLTSISESTVKPPKAQQCNENTRKDPRRRTIFIPDDTTVMTIHPGHSDFTQPDMSILNQRPRRSKRMSLSQAPRRFPLQQDHQEAQVPNVVVLDRIGAPTGKENLPPGMQMTGREKDKPTPLRKRRSSHMYVHAKSPISKASESVTKPRLSNRTSNNAAGLQSKKVEYAIPTTTNSLITKHCSAVAVKTGMKRKYPLIDEDIEDMRTYNENWLSSQETVLHEVVNRIFGESKPRPSSQSKDLRSQLLALRNGHVQQHMRRVDSSILYGALALPKDHIHDQASRYIHDVGLRTAAVDLWVNSYEHSYLIGGLEVVVGRKVTGATHKFLAQYIESCLLRNEDMSEEGGGMSLQKNQELKNWQRTMQRSLTLILLLDDAKTKGLLSDNLFNESSKHKSSLELLEAWLLILRGSSAESVRSLRLLGYDVTYKQDVRSEYEYNVENIAIDFRDGMRLARLVDLLNFPTNHDSTSISGSKTPSRSMVRLSSKIKYPATSRSTKLENIRLCLNTLRSIECVSTTMMHVVPHNIVDGHREQTILLLWALVSQFTIGPLIDWQDLQAEIARLESDTGLPPTSQSTKLTLKTSRMEDYQRALRRWTSLLAAKHDIPIKNFSTAFSLSPNPCTAIIKEYLPFMDGVSGSEPNTLATTLSDQLEQVGCSRTFSILFRESNIFDKNFVHMVLAFLASRVLAGSKVNRTKRQTLKTLAEHSARAVGARSEMDSSARIIQRAWRRYIQAKLSKGVNVEEDKTKEIDFWLL